MTQYGLSQENSNDIQSNDRNNTTWINKDRIITFARIGLSLIVLSAALYIILSKEFSDDYGKWAFGMVGIIVGYWLR